MLKSKVPLAILRPTPATNNTVKRSHTIFFVLVSLL